MENRKKKQLYIRPGELAAEMGCSTDTINRYVDDGLFKGSFKTPGGHRRIPIEFLHELKKNQKKHG